MIKVTFNTADGEQIVAEGTGGSMMELALENNVPGIDGDCGGVCSCATCHVHIAQNDFAKVGEPNEIEKDMLELTDDVSGTSRLCCQVPLSEDIDGISVTVVRD
ncbi:2Fe-2S iron-sulfur cluster binding domain-containing protein [Alteromonas sp. MMG017]|uniref:2Fe-2S iron-sulfur cluster-binding protein n=1 Tax=Alteromonas sp. MMG017 TaxID=2822692 RepID=UPI001B3A435D|nr:2Fe-2S iron-sulfur cluster-binding protein [Alteromonas sp. MMG017]MBQ4828929.1 2Fe-2S iron-sulfur cluster binding domain-containing protein [Alteromonas sp. MMG017]